MKTINNIVIITALLFTGASFASSGGGKKYKRNKAPSKMAMRACENKQSGDECTVGKKEMQGTCMSPSDDKPLKCKPNKEN